MFTQEDDDMQLSQLIDLLSAVERRHPGKFIDVEARDDAGFPLSEFDVKTEYIVPSKRITVRFHPKPAGHQKISDTCCDCQQSCSSDCKCWCHTRET
jgi:hypothetical protein